MANLRFLDNLQGSGFTNTPRSVASQAIAPDLTFLQRLERDNPLKGLGGLLGGAAYQANNLPTPIDVMRSGVDALGQFGQSVGEAGLLPTVGGMLPDAESINPYLQLRKVTDPAGVSLLEGVSDFLLGTPEALAGVNAPDVELPTNITPSVEAPVPEETPVETSTQPLANLQSGNINIADAIAAADNMAQISGGDDVVEALGNEIVSDPRNDVDKGFLERLNEEIDLFTVGATLLATNGNGESLASNLGVALSAGKQKTTAKKDKAKAESEEQRKADLEERRVKVAEAQQKADAQYQKLLAQGKIREADASLAESSYKLQKVKLDAANKALDVQEKQAQPTQGQVSSSDNRLRNLAGIEDLNDIDKEEQAGFKQLSTNHANYSHLVKNGVMKFMKNNDVKSQNPELYKLGLELNSNSKLRELVAESMLADSNPSLIGEYRGWGTTRNSALQESLDATLNSPYYNFLIQNIGN